jgi:hypothetical protein
MVAGEEARHPSLYILEGLLDLLFALIPMWLFDGGKVNKDRGVLFLKDRIHSRISYST